MSSDVKVAVLMGSRSDLEEMEYCRDALRRLEIPHETRILSAHRTPKELTEYVDTLEERGVQVVVAAAGIAAHLAGVVASHNGEHVRVPLLDSPRQLLYRVDVDRVAGQPDDFRSELLERLIHGVVNPLIENPHLVVGLDSGRQVLQSERFEEKDILPSHGHRGFRRFDQQDSHCVASWHSGSAVSPDPTINIGAEVAICLRRA